jgi:putative FmdB family regulatory protein
MGATVVNPSGRVPRPCKERNVPAYDFKCRACSEVFEVSRAASDDSSVPCPGCGGDTKRVFSAVGVHFRGSGFHNTDYRAKPKDVESSAPTCEAAGSSGGCAGCPAAATTTPE